MHTPGQKLINKKLRAELAKVRRYLPAMRALPDDALRAKTPELRARLAGGETPESILPEAFAAMCEADRRVLGLMPFDVQIMAAAALYRGYLAEMNTGEGKTLTATLPLYLGALTGESTILVTTNEYLALRDAREMGPAYEFMGLTVRAGVKRSEEDRFTIEEKKQIYAADIVYTTHSALGFDYLIDNLAKSAGERFLRPLGFVIIDEADSVLLDAAVMPLIISGSPRVQSNLYETADLFVRTLKEDEDFEKEERAVWLTETGLSRAESYFGINNIFAPEHFEIYRHVMLALRARYAFERERDYIVSPQGEVVLIDAGSGRLLGGVRLRGGQHQALECREGLTITPENRAVASVTYQNFFSMFPKMAGMSGTIYDARRELREIYGKRVVVIPPNRPVRRKDLPDLFFANSREQFEAAVALTKERHETGQPVLVFTASMPDSEVISQMLMEEGVPHSLLNAGTAFWEAEVIKDAGQRGAVTVATSMAGRGTDIRLGEGVSELGGLAVIGVGRMLSIRHERQARGRAGRQGDPGFSRFFVSLEDEVVRFGAAPEKLEKYTEGRRGISPGRIKRIVNGARRISEELGAADRKTAKDHDKVLRLERKLVYDTRNRLLDGGTIEKSRLLEIAEGNIDAFLGSAPALTLPVLQRYLLDNISYRLEEDLDTLDPGSRPRVRAYLLAKVSLALEEKRRSLGSDAAMNEFVRIAALSAIDGAWIEQVDYLQQLRAAVSGRSSAQRDLLVEYQEEALASFRKAEAEIKRGIMRNVCLGEAAADREHRLHIVLP